MNFIPKIFIFVLAVSLCATGLNGDEKTKDAAKLEKGKILKTVTPDETGEFFKLELKAIIQASPETVWQIFSNVEGWQDWIPTMTRGWALSENCLKDILPAPKKDDNTKSRVLNYSPIKTQMNSEGQTSVVTFEEFDFPWPVSNDWIIRELTFDANRPQEIYTATWKQLFKNSEKEGGAWRISRYNGSSNATLLDYTLNMHRKPYVPGKVFEVIIGMTADLLVDAAKKESSRVH